MRLYRVRFTIRCMMVAVATVGFVLGSCIVLKRRSDEFAAEAERIRRASQWYCSIKSTSTKEEVRALKRRGEYESRLGDAYERAACYRGFPSSFLIRPHVERIG